MNALDGKVALVTGGGRGIGRAIAERFAREGAIVAITYARDSASADEVVAGIRTGGGRAFALQAELGTHGDAHRLWDAFDKELAQYASGGVDIIVNNAGEGLYQDLESMTEEAFDRVYAVNVRAPFFIVQQALPRLRDGGRIINIGSGVTRLAMPSIMGYGATKGAMDVFTLNLAELLGPRGITANTVAPGIVDTDMNADWLRGNAEADEHWSGRTALRRVGRPDDIADIAAFLASDDARWVTAQVIDATGGADL
ncbi:3-oxoacyl-ACP reductase [Actinomadura sp. CNU-125]|uniref:SDR family oxidoreductase n=1 Tax=Actinomadura sp. CNU-125 TaxID=1904961 RepID=UPI000967D587|nr:SDR family oxidoreductase [Actinomadura sp. CNU-125]OLT32941.1 3-oxoacyl-ACP reductase [Actinomadura sp. CNU-125]